jgi:hypothetical protein
MRIGRRAHGFVDYGTAATELALAALLPATRRTRLLFVSSAVNATLLGAVTDYELGLVRLLPMKAHLALDAVFAATFAGAAATLDETPLVRAVLGALAATGTAAAALTDPGRR